MSGGETALARDGDTGRAALNVELARMEVGVHSDLTGLLDAAQALCVRAQQRGWVHEAARARLVLADVEARTDRIEQGSRTERDVLVQAILAGDTVLAARAHHLLGASLDRFGLRTEALAHAADGVQLLPPDSPAHLRVEHTMLLALLSSPQLSEDGLRSRFDQVIADAAALPTPDLLLAALTTYAWLLSERGETTGAATAIQQVQDVAERTATRLNSAALNTIANVLLDRGELARAEQMARAAIAADVPSIDGFHAGEGMLTLAEIRRRSGDLEDAYLLTVGAEDLARAHDLPEIRAFALRKKAGLLADRGHFRSAYEAATSYHDIWETVRSRETDSRAVLLATVLRTDEARRRSAVYEELAERDPLTGVWNRRHLDKLFPAMLGEHEAGGVPISVALVDLDRFKAVNDLRDHQVGDAALCRVAALLDAQLTEPAFTVRLGGDEFLLVLPGANGQRAGELGERVRVRIETEDWTELTQGLELTVTVGVATSTSSLHASTSTLSELMRLADENMYRAKRAGRNRVQGPARRPTGATSVERDLAARGSGDGRSGRDSSVRDPENDGHDGHSGRRSPGVRAGPGVLPEPVPAPPTGGRPVAGARPPDGRAPDGRPPDRWPMDGWPALEPMASAPDEGRAPGPPGATE